MKKKTRFREIESFIQIYKYLGSRRVRISTCVVSRQYPPFNCCGLLLLLFSQPQKAGKKWLRHVPITSSRRTPFDQQCPPLESVTGAHFEGLLNRGEGKTAEEANCLASSFLGKLVLKGAKDLSKHNVINSSREAPSVRQVHFL